MSGLPWIAALSALFLWWFSTGIILLIVRRADRLGGFAHMRALILMVPVLVIGVFGIALSVGMRDIAGAYLGFLSALAIWGWVELAFLTGIIAGPQKAPCPPGLSGIPRFARAWETIAWHEMALTAGLLLIVVLSDGAANQVALWTYLTLFVARISAKLNLFFGVPYITTEFVPRRLSHLLSYFRRGPVTAAFPIGITVLTFATACFLWQLALAPTDAEAVGWALLSAIAGLAMIEHWLMLVPLAEAKLWRWMLPAPLTNSATEERPGQ
ncbi:putative photosynthetic complex assembly protein PuhE [Aestuariibius sp. 2305UL40-4]|uniref:putative photosynthetic complex assembly protein PuhE n=1 Tax=Aestuariibius violaceus TaxID=3234132 RepID=UPI00345E1C56